jgi:epoxyqueuosine reductase QueG
MNLQNVIGKLDVDVVGVADISQWKGTKLDETAKKLLPKARSVVVLGMEVYPEVLNLISPGRLTGAASMNDLLDRHAEFLSGRITKATYDFAKASRKAGFKALPLPSAGCPMDTRFLDAIFSYKHAGEAAGLGKIGWSSLLVTPEFGARVRLGICLTEAELEPTPVKTMELDCADCGDCIKTCPAGALSKPRKGEPYAINKYACSAFRVSGGGCSECLRVCPAG